MDKFKEEILAGIPQDRLPEPKPYDKTINHAPKRKDILTAEEKVLALKNALRYFPAKFHAELAPEFAEELQGLRTHLHVPFPPVLRHVRQTDR